MFITIDPYYSTQFYNESLEALKNNEVQFTEYIYIKSPYDWYLDVDKEPIMVNYDRLPDKEKRWLVSTVQPLRENDAYLLIRRDNDKGPKALLKFVENEPLKEARLSDYAVFFTVKNREEMEQITREFPGKIWYFGRYFNNKYKVCLCTNKMIKNFISKEQVLLEKGNIKEPGRFEAEFNWRILRNDDMLIKFTETPYFKDGKYFRPSIRSEFTHKFII